MKTNLATFPKPVDGRPTVEELKYTNWKRNFEKELQQLKQENKLLSTDFLGLRLQKRTQLQIIGEILGENPQ